MDINGEINLRLSGFDNPGNISINQATGNVWISDAGNDRIIWLSKDIPDSSQISVASGPYHKIFSGFQDPVEYPLIIQQETAG